MQKMWYGAPTLEMWVDSWNATENTKLYYSNTGKNGYYLGTTVNPTTTRVDALNKSNDLYFPVTPENSIDENYYWIASPLTSGQHMLTRVENIGAVSGYGYDNAHSTVRPIVRLKADVTAEKNENGVWELQ